MSPRRLIVGTRGSALALAQTETVVTALREHHPSLTVEVRTITTQGDRRRDLPLTAFSGRGAFVRAIQAALLDGEVDLAVHSLKDLPTAPVPGLILAATPRRANPRDVLVTRPGVTLTSLPLESRVGTGSLRRQAQLLAWRRDLQVVGIRGNVDTRLRKLTQGEVDALVLAAAGLIRLGRWSDTVWPLPVEIMLPAVGQGALALEVRADDAETQALVAPLNHAPTWAAVTAERAFLRTLGGGCQVPVAAYGRVEAGELLLDGLVATPDGQKRLRSRIRGHPDEAESLGQRLAERLLSLGARCLLEPLATVGEEGGR